MKKVLFVCIHNSARSQMAEAFLNRYSEGMFEAYSAGIEPGTLNPLVVKAMAQKDIDISKNETKSAFDFVKQGKLFNYIVTVCDEQAAQRCPIFPGVRERIMMSFEDPSSFVGSQEEKLEKIRVVRDKIEDAVLDLIYYIKSGRLEENFKED
ncbi:MAG: arsenate reductase ArsC [Campylobacterota bacterium]|nr:arsenate reductase ArsC [Campylobacterota bacterium]